MFSSSSAGNSNNHYLLHPSKKMYREDTSRVITGNACDNNYSNDYFFENDEVHLTESDYFSFSGSSKKHKIPEKGRNLKFLRHEKVSNWVQNFSPRKCRARNISIAAILVSIAVVSIIAVLAFNGSSSNKVTRKEPPDPEVPLPPSWSKMRVFKKGAVCADGAPCASIGKSMLDKNGSAIDAAIATLICNGLVNMHSMGFGGGFLMTIYERSTGKSYVLNSRDRAPRKAHAHMYDNLPPMASQAGGMAIAVPGELAGYWAAHRRFGRLKWSELFEPSIELCKGGYNLTKSQFDGLGVLPSNIYSDPTLKELFVNPETGKFYKIGSTIRPKKLCDTMRIIAEKTPNELYNGTLGKTFIEDIQNRGGILTMEDLNDYRPKWEESITTRLSNGYEINTADSPAGGGLLIFALNILDEFQFHADSLTDINSTVLTYHRLIETFKYTFAVRAELGDKSFVDMSALRRNLTSKKYAKLVREMIDDDKTYNDPKHYGAKSYDNSEDHGTAHISVLDATGDAVSVTSSINLYFGSGVVSERTGILANSAMDDFGIPGKKSYFGLPPTPNNYIAPGKQPLSSMSPTIIVDSNRDVKMVIGAAGGTKIITSIAQVIAKILWMNLTVKEAVDAPRIHHQLYPMEIANEYGVLKQVLEGLRAKGHRTKRYRDRGGIVCSLVRVNDTITANADHRKGGDVYGLD